MLGGWRVQREQSRPLIALLFAAGCGASPSSGNGGLSGSSGSGEQPTASTAVEVTSTTTRTASETSAGTDTASGSGESTSGCDFICDSETGPSPFECSVLNDSCPPGEKCNYYDDDGGGRWNASNCFPVVERPDVIDAECMMFGDGASGLDSCDRGAMCLHLNSNTGIGECVPFCTGSPSNPACDDPTRDCSTTADGVLLVCYPGCDPLDPDSCAQGEGCYGVDGALRCHRDVSGRDGGGPLSPCESINACKAGSTCMPAQRVGACPPDADDCCTPFCTLSVPECPTGTQCVPYFAGGGATPPGYEHVGVCGTELAH